MIIVESLEQAREALSSKEKTMICFMARWCPPCRMINLSFEQFEEENPDAKIYKIDVNEYRDLAKELEAVSVPVTLFVNNGHIVSTHKGFLEAAELTKIYNKNIE